MSRIINVTPLEDYQLEVDFDNGSRFTVSFQSKLSTIRFGVLADKEMFARATADGTCISWDGKIEISISELLSMAQNQR